MFMFMYCGCDQAGQLGERGSLGREGWGEVTKVVAPACVNEGPVVLAPMASFELCTDHMSGFMGPGNPSSFYNYFVKSSLLASRWLVGGRMRQPRMTANHYRM
jgi:hypothetical protein